MYEIEGQEFGVESAAIMDYRDAWACRFLAMATQKQIESVASALEEKICACLESRFATVH